MTIWNPGKQHRRELVSLLDGYIDAIASMDGQYRSQLMCAHMIRKRGRPAESALRAACSRTDSRIVAITKGSSWTEVEYFFRREFLEEPFADSALGALSVLDNTRSILAFKAADLVSMLAVAFKPAGILHVELEHPDAHRFVGGLVDYKIDALWITSFRRVRIGASESILAESPAG